MAETHTYIDLFAGCGGLSLGLHNAGWKGLFAIEKGKDSFETLKHNLIEKRKHFSWVPWLKQRNYSILYILQKYKENLKLLRNKVDLVAGGPPCQGFSMAGRRNESDERNNLVKAYIKFIKLVKPKLIFFENVKGFTLKFKKNQEKGKIYSEYVIDRLTKAGYHVHGKLINFGDYGIPQKRTRFILVGIRNDVPNSSIKLAKEFFTKLEVNKLEFLYEKNLPLNPNLEDAISDLLESNGVGVCHDSTRFNAGKYAAIANSAYQTFMREGVSCELADSHRFAKHRPYMVERLQLLIDISKKNVDIGKNLRDQLSIKKHTLIPLSKDFKCPTLTTHPDDLVHYSEPRILTVREYARIQSFPDNFKFRGNYTTGGLRRRTDVPRYTQIGNAIPPLFGELAGISLAEFL